MGMGITMSGGPMQPDGLVSRTQNRGQSEHDADVPTSADLPGLTLPSEEVGPRTGACQASCQECCHDADEVELLELVIQPLRG